MSIDTSPTGWLEELRYSAESLKPKLESLREDKLAFTGLGFSAGEGRDMPENAALEWFALFRGQTLLGNPQVRVTSPLEGDPAARALALTMAMNTVSKRLQLCRVNEQLLGDFGFKWATCLIKNAPPPGFAGLNSTKKWPWIYRVSPTKYRFDPGADRPDSRVWQAHLQIGSRKQLIKQAKENVGGWNLDALERLANQDVKKWREPKATTPERDELAYWEIWCVEEEVDYLGTVDGVKITNPGSKAGYNGTIFTIADDQPGEIGFIRDPQAAFVPPWGPYITGGDYLVPDEQVPMGPITASTGQAAFLNRTKRATNAAIEAYKRIIVSSDPKLAAAIKSGNMDWVFSIEAEDLRSKLMQVEVGGATEQHFAAEASAEMSLQKVQGITDLMKGIVDPRNKATQDVLAAQASGNRSSGTLSKYYQLINGYLYTAIYFINIDDDVEIELGPQAKGMFTDSDGNPTTRLRGGLERDQDPEEFFNLDLELRVGSMERSLEMDNQLKLAILQETYQEMATFGLATAPYADVQAYLDEKAEMTGMPILKRLFNVPMMRALGMAMIQAGMQQGAGGEQSGGPTSGGSKPLMMFAGNKGSGGGGAAKLPGALAGRAGGPAPASAGASRALKSKGPSLDARPGGK